MKNGWSSIFCSLLYGTFYGTHFHILWLWGPLHWLWACKGSFCPSSQKLLLNKIPLSLCELESIFYTYPTWVKMTSQDEKTFVKWTCTKTVWDFPFISLYNNHLILLTLNQWLLCDLFTHSIDSRQLLWKVQHDGNKDSLAIHGGAEELWNGHLLLSHHLLTLLPHLLHVRTHFISAPQFY